MPAITMTVPPTRGTLIASSESTSGFSVYAVTMPSNSGIRKLCAHDKANTVASAARIPSAKPRALTCIRAGGKVTSDASTVESSCSAAPAESGTLVAAETAGAFIARGPTATVGSAFLPPRTAARSLSAGGLSIDVEAITLCASPKKREERAEWFRECRYRYTCDSP